MSGIEPNLAALGYFAAFWAVCCLGFLQLAGMYPMVTRPGGARAALVIGNTLLWLILLGSTVLFGLSELRPTTIILAAGLLFLFIPELFQALPQRWRDSQGGLVAGGIALAAAIVAVTAIGAAPILHLF